MNSWKIGGVNPKRSTKNMDHLDHLTVKCWHWKSVALEAEFAIGTGIYHVFMFDFRGEE